MGSICIPKIFRTWLIVERNYVHLDLGVLETRHLGYLFLCYLVRGPVTSISLKNLPATRKPLFIDKKGLGFLTLDLF